MFLLFAALLLSTPIAVAEEAGEVVSLLGRAEILREGHWQPLQVGAAIAVGELIKTAEGSRMAVQLTNGSQLKLNANSQLELKPPTAKKIPTSTEHFLQKTFRLLGGEIWVRGTQNLEVETIAATATIRGTEFNLAVESSGVSRLAVLEGAVEFHNPYGRVWVAAHEQATAKKGEAPRKMMLVEPLDAVQWSLYYPTPPLDRTSQEKHRTAPSASDRWLAAAHDHLLRGEVPQAQQALDRVLALDPHDARAYSLRAIIDLVQNRKTEARVNAERAVAADPASSVAYLTLSWTQQAEFDLDGALASARQAVAFDPDSPHALTQESRLLFGMGEIKPALQAAERARQHDPNDALVNSTWGFLQLAQGHTEAAKQAFEDAIAQDSTLGEPHLGLGLALFRQNQAKAAVTEIEKATLLEPKVSLYNSYLGKAYFEIKDDRLAQKYLAQAKALDSRDPTPYFYDAVRLQSSNQPIAAIENLQTSITLNDHRAVYRSKLLLDEDLAARDATLGKLYNEVGFQQLGLQEGWKSLSRDPANHSAHRLLADAYAAIPGVESARASELLQAQLLQPINITPVSPQMAETKLLMPPAGPITPSLYEFNPLFVRNQSTLFLSGWGGTQGTWGNELVASGLIENFSYSLGQFHYQSNGYRPNNDLENNLYNLFVQTAVTPDFNLQAEYRHRETMGGDLQSRFDGSFSAFRRRHLSQDTARIGARYSLSRQADVIASAIYTNRNLAIQFPKLNISLETEDEGLQAEGQLLYRTERFNLVSGLGVYDLSLASQGFDESDASTYQIAYGYANIKLPERVIWTLGLSYESAEHPTAKVDVINPKFGMQWAITDQVTLRAAAFKAVKRNLDFEQTIEPTQVAGFNQLADYLNLAISKNFGAALDVRFNPHLFGGIEALRRDTEVPFGPLASPESHEVVSAQEDFISAYLYWLPSRDWALSAAVRHEIFQVPDGCARCTSFYPARLETLSLPLNIHYSNPSGFFTGLSLIYVYQTMQSFDSESLTVLPQQNEDFVVVNAGLGYRLSKRWGIIALQANNLFDQTFRFQDYSFQTGTGTVDPLYLPERTVSARMVLNF